MCFVIQKPALTIREVSRDLSHPCAGWRACHASPLGICEPQTLRAQLLPEDEVLSDQVLDQHLLSPLEGACTHGNQELERAPRHSRVKIRLDPTKFIRRTPLASTSNRRIPFKIYLDLISAPYAVVSGKPRPIAYDNSRYVKWTGAEEASAG